MSPPSSGSKNKTGKKPAFDLLATCFTLVSCLPYSTLKMEATCSPEKSVDFQQTTQYYMPEYIILHQSMNFSVV
jgi:hypothetical protein